MGFGPWALAHALIMAYLKHALNMADLNHKFNMADQNQKFALPSNLYQFRVPASRLMTPRGPTDIRLQWCKLLPHEPNETKLGKFGQL